MTAMELRHTVEMMNSADYKERFKAEYYQTKIRYEKLRRMCASYEMGTLPFKPSCSLDLLTKQLSAMDNYLHCLEERAEIEGIKLYD
jgi:hypothetical protein